MRLRSVTFRGLTRFTGDPVTIDFDSLGPGLIALVGANGEGKTTAMESVPAVLYRTFPTRPGSIYDHAHGRDSFIEATFDDAGDEIRVRLAIDADRRLTEGYVFLNGASLTTGRAAEFESVIEQRFGSLPLFLASVFAAQDKSGSFLLKKKADRKSLFIELLGLAALEVLAQGARERRSEAERALDSERQRIADVEDELVYLPSLQSQLEEAAGAVSFGEANLADAREEEASALAALERARAAGEKLAALKAAADSARRELEAADKALAAAKAKPAEIEKDIERRLRFVGESDPEKLKEPARRRHAETMERLTKRRVALEAALKDVPDREGALAAQRSLQVVTEKWEALLAAIQEARSVENAAIAKLERARDRLSARREALKAERERLTRQAVTMKQAPCAAENIWGTPPDQHDNVGYYDLAGTCPLLADARGARETLEKMPTDVAEVAEAEKARIATADVQAHLYDLLREAGNGDEQAARTHDLKKSALSITRTLAAIEAAEAARQQLADLVEEATEAHASLARDMKEAEEKAAAALEQRKEIEADRAEAIFAADAVLELAEAAVKAAAARYGPAARALQEAQDVDVAAAVKVHDVAIGERERAEETLRDRDIERAALLVNVSALEKKAEALAIMRGKLLDQEIEVGDWTLLERALGKDGVQALEIDASGPQVSDLVNELLTSCYGPRFSIAFATLREKKSAKGEFAESFDVQVFDNGAERAVEALSGGERVVIGEAIGLAIAILNARKSGVRWENLWRDETAGALDPENAQAYVLMLRRARELGGFHQVIFVSHQPEVWEAADVRLVVAGGRVSVEVPGVAA